MYKYTKNSNQMHQEKEIHNAHTVALKLCSFTIFDQKECKPEPVKFETELWHNARKSCELYKQGNVGQVFQ